MAETARASSSSSIFGSSRSIERVEKKKSEEEETLQALRASLPIEFRPAPYCRRWRSADNLIAFLEGEPFLIPLPDAIDIVSRWGVEAVEGAMLASLCKFAAGFKPRSKVAWLVETLKRGLGWKPEYCQMYVLREWEKGLDRMETSDNATYQRLAKELRLKLGAAPENVTPLLQVRRAE